MRGLLGPPDALDDAIKAHTAQQAKKIISIPYEAAFNDLAWKFPSGDVKYFSECNRDELLEILSEVCLKIRDEAPSKYSNSQSNAPG